MPSLPERNRDLMIEVVRQSTTFAGCSVRHRCIESAEQARADLCSFCLHHLKAFLEIGRKPDASSLPMRLYFDGAFVTLHHAITIARPDRAAPLRFRREKGLEAALADSFIHPDAVAGPRPELSLGMAILLRPDGSPSGDEADNASLWKSIDRIEHQIVSVPAARSVASQAVGIGLQVPLNLNGDALRCGKSRQPAGELDDLFDHQIHIHGDQLLGLGALHRLRIRATYGNVFPQHGCSQ